MTTPVFKAIKNQFPGIFISVMAPLRVKGVYENNPDIDEIISFDEKNSHKSLLSKLRFIALLRKKNFDRVFLIHRSFSRALICALAGIKQRIGYRRAKNNLVLTTKINPVESLHRQDHYLNLFIKSGIVIKDKNAIVYPSRTDTNKAGKLLQEIKGTTKFVVGINPAANWKFKRWPISNFSQLAKRLIKELNCSIFFVGTKKEDRLITSLITKINAPCFNLCGQTSIGELAALLKQSDAFISNDSGPAHLAASCNIPTLIMFGPTAPEITAPRGNKVTIIKSQVSCLIPCYKPECDDNKCMTDITVAEVFNKTREILR